MKVFVGFDTKYGNTKLVAQKIQEGLEKIEGIDTKISSLKEIKKEDLESFEAIVLGGPNHMGRPTGTVKTFINQIAKFELKLKKVAIFGTYAGKERTEDRAVKKTEKIIKNKLQHMKIIQPTLSIKVKKIRGPVLDGQLPRCVDFGKEIGLKLINV